jgi:hypothetical protein
MFDDIMRGECLMYDFETIRAATGGFCPENESGRGGFGIVYKVIMLYTLQYYNNPSMSIINEISRGRINNR